MVDLPRDAALIRAHLTDVELIPLLAAVAHLTGRDDLLGDDLRPDPQRLREPNAGYTAAQMERATELISAALADFARGTGQPAPLDASRTGRILGFLAGQPVPEGYVAMLTEELAIAGDELRAPRWTVGELDRDRAMRAVVIGAGMSGIVATHRLRQIGVDVVVVERNQAVGGTWVDNVYPGCRVDIQNHMYSYSFAQRRDWPHYFSPQETLRGYFTEVADDLGVSGCVRFGHEVEEARWDDEAAQWIVTGRVGDAPFELRAELLVTAVGQLNRPYLPAIPGRDEFAGVAFHSAAWDTSVDLAGKRVVVIGTGSSGCQLIPPVVEQAAEVTVALRTPPWLLPVPNYQHPVSPGQQWVFRTVPHAANWYRVALFWRMTEGLLPAAIVDPDHPPSERSVSALNEATRQLLQGWIDLQTEGDPELRTQLTPGYPPFAKRCVLDDGSFVRALRQPNCTVVTAEISRIEPGGVRFADGRVASADVIVYATGFQASDFLTPMRVVGRGGRDLRAEWAGDARAHLGMMVPGFPNLFMMYGPNTNIVVNGSIIYFSECEANYLVECVRTLVAGRARSLEPTEEATSRYTAWIDAGNAARAWGVSAVSSWYRNATGRTAQNWPFSLLEFWEQTRGVDPDAVRTEPYDRVR